jgi:hypothetical protein
MNTRTPFIHPETRPGEALLCYSDECVYGKIPYTRKRRGTLVYNEFGGAIDVSQAHPKYRRFPVFVPAADIAAVHEAVFNSISIELVPI